MGGWVGGRGTSPTSALDTSMQVCSFVASYPIPISFPTSTQEESRNRKGTAYEAVVVWSQKSWNSHNYNIRN